MKELLENRQKGDGISFLRKVDIFGVPIQINFNNESKHTTRFGGIISLTIFGLLLTYLFNLLFKIAYKSDPFVISEEIIVENPARFDLTNENFTFAVTLLDENYVPFLDETYYKVTCFILYKVDETQPDGTITQKLQLDDVELSPCTKDSFKVSGTEEYFLAQKYESMYCVKDISKLYIEGQFEKERFSVIQFNVQQCQGSKCQKVEEKTRKLKKSQLQIYYSNSIVKMSNVDSPFQPMGQSQFWETNLDFPQVINLTYKNTYVYDDLGLISDQQRLTKNLLFSNMRTSTSSQADQDQIFYRVSLFMEKNREQEIRRKFLKLTDAVSQVGGIYNVLFFVGCLLAQPFSYLELERKIVNSTFSFSTQQTNSDGKENQKKNKDNKKNKGNQLNKNLQDQNKQNINKNQNDQSNNNNTYNQNLNETFSNRDQIIENKQGTTERPVLDHNSQNKSSEIEQNYSQNQNVIKTVFQEFKIKSIEYVTYYLRCFKCFRSDFQLILKFGTSKIFEFTDICYMVNKLIELEKLKHLILNEQQLKLFEYIPKPNISKSIIDLYQSSKLNDKQLKKAIRTKTQMQISDNEIGNRRATQQLNILTIMNRSQLDKAREAQKAFNYIYKQQKKQTKIDKKLLLLLDENHIPLFNANSFDSSLLGGYASLQQIREGSPIPDNQYNNDQFAQYKYKKSLFDQVSKENDDYSKQDDIVQSQDINSKVNENNSRQQEQSPQEDLSKFQDQSRQQDFSTRALDQPSRYQEDVSRYQEEVSRFQEDPQRQGSPPKQMEDIVLPCRGGEDIQSSYSCVLNHPQEFTTVGASPKLYLYEDENNEEDEYT